MLPLPAVIDFTANELEWYKTNNARRLISGILLGFAVGIAGYTLLNGKLILSLLEFAWLVMLEFAVAVILRCTGRIDRYIERYEKGILK